MIRRRGMLYLLFFAAAAAASTAAFGQAVQQQTWAQDIAYLQMLRPAEAVSQKASIEQIRAEIELWIKAHPTAKMVLAAAPAKPLTAEKELAEVKELNRVIKAIIAQDSSHPFHLGTVTVNVNADANNELSPQSDGIDQIEMAKLNKINVASALEYLPGVTISHGYSGRNQQEISIHGFGYLQVPVYIDGVPVGNSYDGTVDFRNFPTTSISEIQVAKGFSSPLLGSGAVGGAVNIVTKVPHKKYEAEALMGTYSGKGVLASLRLGSRWKQFFIQGSIDWYQHDYIPLSGNFVNSLLQPNDHLNNSYAQNGMYTGRFGFTPKGKGEYVFSYQNQKANSGIPLTTGNDPIPYTYCSAGTDFTATNKTYVSYTTWPATNLYACYSNSGTPYRSWSYWDLTSYYFHSNTPINKNSSVKFRVFYDQYPNLMYFYSTYVNGMASNNLTAPPVFLNVTTAPVTTYPVAIINSSNTTAYKDHTDGFSVELTTRAVKRNILSASFFFKDDLHKEVPMVKPTVGPAASVDRMQNFSIGLQDIIALKRGLSATIGASFDHVNGLQATDTHAAVGYYAAFVNPKCPGNTDYTKLGACTLHGWGFNPQASLAYTFNDTGRIFLGFAQKVRFPEQKELYSYKSGKGVPNPTLHYEQSNNWQIGYSRPIGSRTSVQLEYFRSDLKNAVESIGAPESVVSYYTLAYSNSLTTSNLCASSSTCSISENASHETHQGAEFTLHSVPVSRLTIDANYTYINKEIDGFSFAGQPLIDTTTAVVTPCGTTTYQATGPGASTLTTNYDNSCLTATDLPRHKAVGAATAHLPHDTYVTTVLRYESGNKAIDNFHIGTQLSAYTNTTTNYAEIVHLSNFATWDMSVTSPFFVKDMRLQAGMKNILDRNYYQTLGIPEEGRNWFFNARYNF